MSSCRGVWKKVLLSRAELACGTLPGVLGSGSDPVGSCLKSLQRRAVPRGGQNQLLL